jgi:glucose-6-phosphate 1-dehydrogenase
MNSEDLMANFVPVDEFDLIIFGGTGDLALRKLLPALYHRVGDGQVTGNSRIIAASRGAIDRDTYITTVEQALRENLPPDEFHDEQWAAMRDRIHYAQCDAFDAKEWGALVDLLADAEDRVRVAYLSTAPGLFGPIAQGLKKNGLISANSRIVLEKPLGRDYESACAINNEVGECFAEPVGIALCKLAVRTTVATRRDRPRADHGGGRSRRRWPYRVLRQDRRAA